MAVDGLGQRHAEGLDPGRGVRERHHGHDGVAVGHLDRHPGPEQVSLHRVAVRARAGEHDHDPGRVDGRAVEDHEAGHLGQPPPNRGDGLHHGPQQCGPVTLEQRPGRVDAGQDGAGRARRGRRLDGRIEAARADPAAGRQHDRPLRPGRERLVGARDERVGTGREGVRGKGGMEAEVRAPRGIDDERHVVPVSHRGKTCHVTHRSHIRRVTDEHRASVRGRSQGRLDRGR